MPPSPSDTCWTVLRAAARGDEAARSAFSRAYAATIRGYLSARWRGRLLEGETDDAAQEVFLECFKPGGVLERADTEVGDSRGLLYGVTRNIARRFEERAVAGRRVLPEDSAWLRQVVADEPGQATLFDRSWARALMRQAKRRHRETALADGRAGERRLELLERRFGNEESIREVATRWGVPAQGVHNAYRKARIEFYGCLREVVAFHAPPGADLDAECRRLLEQLR